jgi:hypothetical protein
MTRDRPLRGLRLAGLLAALVAPALAQQQPALSPDEQVAPRQVQTLPAAKPKPRAARSLQPADTPAAPAGPSPSVSCNGIFSRDSTHLKLAQLVGAKNIELGEVAGAGGSTLNASVLYPKDPKRRLEVLWQNEAAHSGISLIAITGQSQVRAPKGLRLGLALPALEKINGKPFKLSGFDQPDGSAALDWQGGALASLPGGCDVGIKFKPDSKATPDALAAAAGKDFLSSDAAIRAVKPVVGEIILGYQ